MNNIQEFINQSMEGLVYIQPELALSIGLITVLVIDLFLKKELAWLTGWFTVAVLVVTLFFINFQVGVEKAVFFRMVAVDSFSVFFKYIFVFAGILATLFSLSSEELKRNRRRIGEYCILILGLVLGMNFMVSSTNLLMMFLSIEMVSICSFVLVSYLKDDKSSNEAGMKYVIYGAFSSGLMIYGISLIFGITGSLDLAEINRYFASHDVNPMVTTMAVLLMLGGFGYKISAAPFHFWAPDAYEGAPTPITALLSVGPKAAGFAMLIRFLKISFTDSLIPGGYQILSSINWPEIIMVMAVLTMTIGNLSALWQTNVKRMLAYSSIAHAGYLLMGVVLLSDQGISAIMFYLTYYMLMNLGAFYALMLMADRVKSFELDDLRGMGMRLPIVAVPMVIFLASLTGIPGTVGFVGKFLLFVAVLEKGSIFFWLTVIAVLNSVVSAFYYFKIAKMMYLKAPITEDDKEPEQLSVSPMAAGLLVIITIPTIVLGLFWEPLYTFAQQSVKMIAL